MSTPAKMGRPLRMHEPQPTLDGEGAEPLADAVVRMIRAGTTLADACGCVYPPLPVETYSRWMRVGAAEAQRIEGGAEPDPKAAEYLVFYQRVKQAELHAKVEAVLTIREAITGMDEVETTTTTVRKPTHVIDEDDRDTIVYEETTTTVEKRSKKKYWAAAMTYLERKHPHEYAWVTRDIAAVMASEPEDFEAKRERALELVDELSTKRDQRALDQANDANG